MSAYPQTMVRVSEGRKAFLVKQKNYRGLRECLDSFNVLCQKCGTATEWGIAIREFYYLASAAAIATMVAGFAVPASAQPFSSVMGSWGYGGYGAFHMVLWVLIVIAFILGVVWRVWHGTRRNGGGVVGPAAAGRTNAHGGVAKTRTIKGPTNRRPKSK